LHTPGLGMTYSESQQLALIPQHLQQRVPGHRTGQGDEDKAGIEYTPAQSQSQTEKSRPNRSRGARIAMGILIPVAIGGLAVGIGAAVVLSNWESL